MEGVTLYTAMIASEPGIPPLRRVVPEPKTPERDDSDIEDLSPGRSDYSPKRLRRIRGSVSGASSTSIPVVASDDETVIVNVSHLKPRRNSAHLHHPKQLKSSPKSAYFEDAAGVETGRRSSGVMEFESAGVPIPQSPISFDEGVPVGRAKVVGFEPINIRRPDSPPASTVVSSDDEDSEHGGALLDGASSYSNNNATANSNAKSADVKGKARVLAKSGKKVTPWATRASSFTSERPESLISTEGSESPKPVVQAIANLPVEVVDGSSEPAVRVVASLPVDVEVGNKPAVQAIASLPVETEEDSGDEIFEDAIEEPLKETPIAVETSSGSSLVDSMQEIRDRTAQNSKPHDPPASDKIKPTDENGTEGKRVILIYEPPNSAAASPTDVSNPAPNTLLPALKLIPATPLALSSTAEKEKQLGHPTTLSRRATSGATSSSNSIPEDAVAEVEPNGDFTSKPKRPSVSDVPSKVRESKLHPWWMPKRVSLARDDGGDLEHVLSAPSERSTRYFDDLKSRRASTGDKEEKKNGRVTKRIKGTKFVVEFVGWRRIGEVLTGKRRKDNVVLDLEGKPIRKKRVDE